MTNRRDEQPKERRTFPHSDIIFDSNVIDPDDCRNESLLRLVEKLLASPRSGNVWFSLPSLYEVLAPKDAGRRIELLKRFQNLYRQFGSRVRFIDFDLYSFVAAEWSGSGLRSAPASMIDDEVTASIAAGDLVGYLKTFRETWIKERTRIHEEHAERTRYLCGHYEAEQWFRDEFKRNMDLYGTENALEQCDLLAKNIIVSHTKRPPDAILTAKADHVAYPCTWTYALLARLADYAATITKAERELNFARYDTLLTPDRNDLVDAYVAASGGRCGSLVTHDGVLIERINFLHDAVPSLIHLQAFTVDDALRGFDPSEKHA
ncbi:hypothetical protein [Corallococcus sp. AB018]|uniref:hypothetical protein n=1 Tax=Corallococcus sp. AB018 TaxID=2316715 RepID=UPI000F87AB0E|nr:hypothetical protein [Corallococcus sp. AB018]